MTHLTSISFKTWRDTKIALSDLNETTKNLWETITFGFSTLKENCGSVLYVHLYYQSYSKKDWNTYTINGSQRVYHEYQIKLQDIKIPKFAADYLES